MGPYGRDIYKERQENTISGVGNINSSTGCGLHAVCRNCPSYYKVLYGLGINDSTYLMQKLHNLSCGNDTDTICERWYM